MSSTTFHANTAHCFMLTTLKIWDNNGMVNFKAAPIQTWQHAKKFNHYYKRLEDKEGNNYYVSHPPLAFMLNYAILKVFNMPLNQNSLQWILIFIFISGSAMLAWMVTRLSKQSQKKHSYFVALAAIAFYIFNPVNLYAHSQHNFSEIWGQFFLIATLASWTWYLQSDRLFVVRLLLFGSTALLAATDWMGITLIIAMILVYFKQLKKPHIRFGIILMTISVIITTSFVIIQYSSISGFNDFARALGIRFLERSGFFGSHYTDMGYDIFNPDTWLLLLSQINNLLYGSGYLIVLMTIACLIFGRKKCGQMDVSVQKIALWTALIFFIAVFSASSIHYIYTARFTPFIALAGAAMLAKLTATFNKPNLVIIAATLIICAFSYLSVKVYQSNIPQPNSKQAKLDSEAQFIMENKIDTVSFTKEFEERDIIYLSYKSERNIVWSK